MKRLAREEATAANAFFNNEVHSMALQVRDVLPQLPLDIIKRDLGESLVCLLPPPIERKQTLLNASWRSEGFRLFDYLVPHFNL